MFRMTICAAISVLALVGCGKGSSAGPSLLTKSPENVLVDFYDALNKGNISEARILLAPTWQGAPRDSDEVTQRLISISQVINKHKGVATTLFGGDNKCAVTGEIAKCRPTLSANDGVSLTSTTKHMQLIAINGEWKLHDVVVGDVVTK